jgi:hypothetical protein
MRKKETRSEIRLKEKTSCSMKPVSSQEFPPSKRGKEISQIAGNNIVGQWEEL